METGRRPADLVQNPQRTPPGTCFLSNLPSNLLGVFEGHRSADIAKLSRSLVLFLLSVARLNVAELLWDHRFFKRHCR